MGQKLVVGPIDRGLRTDRTAFVIDNDSFPTLINAYQWRGRIKRKRGTSLLTRLMRYFDSTISSYTGINPPYFITLDGAGAGNLFGVYANIVAPIVMFSLQPNGNIVPGTVVITAPGPTVYTDNGDGTLSPSGSINYATGAIVILAEAGSAVSAVFRYYPDLPVMGLEDLILQVNQFPGTLAFDTVYSYNILTTLPYNSYDVSFYKNPIADPINLPLYVPKANITPTTWNGQDYQQFWTVNYQGALWATNGINVPFDTTNIGMQFKRITGVVITDVGPFPPIPAQANLTIVAHGLVVGDFVFINEVGGITGINFQTGYVIADLGVDNVLVAFPKTILGGVYTSGGIAQYLTNRSDVTKDTLRWYDGDPTDGNALTPTLDGHKGWVNFMPPLSQVPFSVADLPPKIYYLVGARMIVPFKDRLLFLGPVIQTSAMGDVPIYLQDTVIFSQNGTPYYTCSFQGPSSAPTSIVLQVLVPDNQTADARAFTEDFTGFGGYIEAGIDSPIITVSTVEDVLIIGFNGNIQTRLVYTGNDIIPFLFYQINSELGSISTFSAINMDKGVITRGGRGFIITGQTEAKRIDLDIPDQVFEISNLENGPERMCAQRDYINEWIYFTYPSNQEDVETHRFPTQTLQYNYRDDSWAIFNECYTTYGLFRKRTGFTWATVGTIYPTWADWNDPWNAGTSTLLEGEVIAGNQQGFVITRADGTGEGNSLYIQSISGSTITSPQHCLSNDDFIIISGAIGSIGTEVNNQIFQVFDVALNTFKVAPPIAAGTYFGGGLIKRMYVPQIQTKQFPLSWDMARKTRIGPQMYLLTTTAISQITLLIFLSQNSSSPYNTGKLVPNPAAINKGLIYSTVLYTCPESTNLGLTAANTNLQMVTAEEQEQIWHRINTALLGDTVQLGFTLSDDQMMSLDVISEAFPITGASQTNPCVLDCTAQFDANTLIKIEGVVGMTELNFDVIESNYYNVLSSTPTQVTIEVDATGFTPYVSGGTVTAVAPVNQFAEIELHGFIMDVSGSMMLA